MLKKTALLLFALAMLISVAPQKANAGVVVALGPVYPRPGYVYVPSPYGYAAPQPYVVPQPYVAPPPYVAYQPYAPAYVYDWGYYPRYYRPGYWYAPRFERRDYIGRRPYFRR
jgi:hypothetical protein